VEKASDSVKKNGGKKREKADPQEFLQSINKYLDEHFEDVGLNFTKEALKIHYGEAKKRNIKGTATQDQEKLLKDEGVQFLKIPILKRLDS
jgi:hypothetical protein